jgi:hypothetical protein
MKRVGRILTTLTLLLLLSSPAWSADPQEESLYSEASRLVESYNGHREYVSRAADLTARLLQKNPQRG